LFVLINMRWLEYHCW